MIFPLVIVIGGTIAALLIITTIIIVQQDKQANRRRALRADQILGALHDSAGSGRPWRSIYSAPPEKVSAGARAGFFSGDAP